MKCLACDSDTQVIDSRDSNRVRGAIRRRRKCKLCDCRFTTVEVIQSDWIAREDLLKTVAEACVQLQGIAFPEFQPRRKLKSEIEAELVANQG